MRTTRYYSVDDIIGNPHSTPPKAPLIPVSRATWYRGIQAGHYPRAVSISPGRVAWRAEDIEKLLNELANQADGREVER